MSLQTDYRPTSFSQVVGNPSVVKAIKANLKRDDHNHCILLTGGSGCGKTTLAYLIAEALGAYSFESQSNPGFREFNASDLRGIDTVRQVRQESSKNPIGSDVRVFFFDECHKLTGDAQEAFLKILEEAEGVNYYIFATTNPEALRPTFKRRCAEYLIGPATEEEVIGLLEEIIGEEQVKVPGDVLEQIAQDSLGSPGIALGILDAVIALPPNEMLAAAERNAAKQNAVIDLCRALAGGKKWKEVADILSGLKGEDPEGIRRAVLGYCSNWLLKQDNKRAYLILDAFAESVFYTGFPGITHAAYMALNM